MYSYSYGMEEDILEFMEEFGYAFLGVLLIIALVALVIGVLLYVFQSVGLYSIAKRRGIRNPWLAWLPIGDYWIAGSIADQYQYVVKGQVRNKRKILLILSIAGIVLTVIMNIIRSAVTIAMLESQMEGSIAVSSTFSVVTALLNCGLNIALIVFWYMTLYDIYSSTNPDNNVLFLVLSIFFRITVPFFLFFNRKKDTGMPPRRTIPQTYAYHQPAYEQPQEPWNEPPEML
ncbi:MAG: hypothetical protein J6C98_10210 [Oscillospiraceae bacterium]|nr:hypothetical protein [Oscillospiraceae bacterium]